MIKPNHKNFSGLTATARKILTAKVFSIAKCLTGFRPFSEKKKW
jgi:hypothetical protein